MGKKGNAEAMRILSAYYIYGLGGVPIDNEKAECWLKESSNQNDEIAMMVLGGVVKNIDIKL